MNVLVLGGTGAMGMSLVPILVSRGNEVFVGSRKQQEYKVIFPMLSR